MTRRRFGLFVLLLGAFLVTTSGCEPRFNFVSVTGTVTKGGRPLRGIEVVFLADPAASTVGPRATGATDEAGHYRLKTDKGDDGAVAGKHVVVLVDLEAARTQFLRSLRPSQGARLSPEDAKRVAEELKVAEAAQRIPSIYATVNKTRLRAEVGSEPLVFDIKLP